MLRPLSPPDTSTGIDRHPFAPHLVNWSATIGFAVLLALWIPLFICMPPWVDNTWYDLGAEVILRGGVVYHEILWHGLPGMLWLQAAIRWLLGWSSEALRAVDLLFFAATVWFLVAGMLPRRTTGSMRLWTALLLFIFYSSTSEWCHCQPDMWMLLPALGALCLRQRQVASFIAGDVMDRTQAIEAFLEGLCWGAAFIIKPFVAVPALCCWFASAVAIWRAARIGRLRFLVLNTCTLLGGGLLVGVATVAALWRTGDWPYFVQTALAGYGTEYYQRSPDLQLRLEKLVEWLWPWSLVHVIALPLAGLGLRGAWRSTQSRALAEAPTPLLSAFYLGWFLQANFLQQHYMYQVVPALVLALIVVCSNQKLGCGLIMAGVLWAALAHPLLNREHLALWGRCWREGSTAEIRDHLTLQADNPTAPDWQELEKVKAFLQRQNLHDRELTCYCTSSVHLYKEMHLRPSTRFILVWALVQLFHSHQAEICQEMYESPQRFVVNDLRQAGLSRTQAADWWEGQPFGVPPLPEELQKFFPWGEQVVFRAGRYLVHAVRPDLRLRPKTAPIEMGLK